MAHNYKGYFQEHYGYKFQILDLINYQNWFYSQWMFILKHTTFSKNIKVPILEIGSSIGGFAKFLADYNIKDYVGIEMDKKAVRYASKLIPNYEFRNISFDKFKTNNKYKYIFAFEVLEHLENAISDINKIYFLLKKNGIFIGTSPFPYKKNIYADKTHQFVLHPDNWKKLFYDAGFTKVETYPMTYFPYIWRIHRGLNIRIPFYLPFSKFISTSLIIAIKE